ncbi:MAG TPA: hypothetical protein VIH57_10085 [Bacteroidales bacterium]
MTLSDEEREKFEADFKFLINKYIEFLTYYNQLLCKIVRTPEEEKEFQTIQKLLLAIGEVLSAALRSLGDDLFGKALDMYYHYKDIASTGNKEAEILLNELKPVLAASLSARINKN